MTCRLFVISALVGTTLFADELPNPPVIAATSLKEFRALDEDRRALIFAALETREEHKKIPYHFGGADPKGPGFDCSGAMYYVLRSLGYQPPRTSSGQYRWILKHQNLTRIPKTATSLKDPVFRKLKPGDLLFWSGTYTPTDGRKTKITHVGMYLGTEKKDGHQVMICASSGRSYRRTRRDGYGVFDFRLPSKKSRAKLVGYGRPPLSRESR